MRTLTSGTLLAVCLLWGWSFDDLAGQGGSGSMVPCRIPMSWTVASVDARFGLTRDEALAAAQQAGRLWSEAVGVELFVVRERAERAYPISFVYDDRQAALDLRGQLRTELDSVHAELELRRRLLETESLRFDSARSEYERDAEAHRRAMTEYNATVREWNQRGGAPDEVRAGLEARLAELNGTQEALRGIETDLGRVSERLHVEVQGLNRRIVDLQRREDHFVRDYSLDAAESGRYDESVMWEGDRVRSVARGIRVFQFTDRSDLVLVLAHEMGHALGLGHAPDRGAVMSEVLDAGEGANAPTGATEVDRRMLAELCPGLGGRGPL